MSHQSRCLVIALNDIRRAVHSRLLLATWGLVVLLVVPAFWSNGVEAQAVSDLPRPAVRAVQAVPGYLTTYVFVFSLVVAYGAVAAERESGRVRLLLGLSGTRRDVLLGTLLGRVVIVSSGIAVILSGMYVSIIAQLPRVPAVAFLIVATWTLVYTIAWTVFTVGLSAAFDSRYRAVATAGGVYLAVSGNAPIWGTLLRPALRSTLPVSSVSFVAAINPTLSLFVLTEWLVGGTTEATTTLGVEHAATSVLSVVSISVFGFLFGARRFKTDDLC